MKMRFSLAIIVVVGLVLGLFMAPMSNRSHVSAGDVIPCEQWDLDNCGFYWECHPISCPPGLERRVWYSHYWDFKTGTCGGLCSLQGDYCLDCVPQ